MLKKLLPYVLIIWPLLVKADCPSGLSCQAFGGQFSGLNNADSAVLIGDNDAQDLSNVDITDNQFGIRKRSGYTTFRAIGTSTWPVRGGYYYRDTTGADNLLHANNRSLYKSVLGGAYSAFLTTDTAGSYYDLVDSGGYLYRFTDNRDQFMQYDGSAVTFSTTAPAGTQGETSSDRLMIAGVAASPNTVYYSQSAVRTNFIIGGSALSDPFSEKFGLPGQSISALKYALGRLLVWTKSTLSFSTSQDQFDLSPIQDVSTTIGTLQPYSVLYDQGVVYWQAQDGHFYGYDGNSVQRISDKIAGSVANFVLPAINQTIYTSETDFETGATISSELTTTESPGAVQFKNYGILLEQWSDGQFTSNPTWTDNGNLFTHSFSAVNFRLVISQAIASPNQYYTLGTTVNFNNGFVDVIWIAGSNGPGAIFLSTAACGVAPSGMGVILDTDPTFSVAITTFTSGFIGGGLTYAAYSFTNGNAYHIRLEKNTTTFNVYVNGVLVQTAGGVSNNPIKSVALGLAYTSSCGGSCPSKTTTFDDVYYSSGTGFYNTGVTSLGFVPSAWSAVSFNDATNGGTLTYGFYTDADTTIDITNPATFVSSQTITSGSIPTVALSSYVAISANFFRNTSTSSVVVNDLSFSYYTGTNTGKTIGVVDKNHRLMWSLSENNSTTNNATYIYDTRFASWLKYSVPFDAPARVDATIYFGSPSAGTVYWFPYGTSDNGSSIVAYWRSKEFIGTDPFVEKAYNNLSLIAKTQSGSSLSVDTYMNGMATSTQTFTVSLTNATGFPYIRYNDRFRSGNKASFISLKFGNTGTTPFEFYSARIDYVPQTWRTLP